MIFMLQSIPKSVANLYTAMKDVIKSSAYHHWFSLNSGDILGTEINWLSNQLYSINLKVWKSAGEKSALCC
ncbi:hypothetical protein AT746_06340 [Lacimicrobium alkaliphilum]|uniref:Uncharacterized protein n=1 Tax=Lacimicrobium alkaliphilum TaxID=1526571 RepID=A0A0U3AIU7_9ALTE|nr:hypothetical protein AT746_06340 [Lacimicrobium alkaliphilum]